MKKLAVILSFLSLILVSEIVYSQSSQGTAVVNSMKFTAYSSNFCYAKENGEWSEFSEWRSCNFIIDYNADDKQFVFDTAPLQKYNVSSIEALDPCVTTFNCQNAFSGRKCKIELVVLPDGSGTQIYLNLGDERICYAVELFGQKREFSVGSRVLPESFSYPAYTKSYTNNAMTLINVIANDSQTILHFEYVYSDDYLGGIWLSPNSSITVYPSGNTYKMIRAEGIETSNDSDEEHHYKGEKKSFKVYFPSMPANTTHFDFKEEGQESDWVLCGISDTPKYKRNFLMLNCTDVNNHSVTWDWYGGQKTFYVATTAIDYDIVGLPSWCEIVTKKSEGFVVSCKSQGNEQLSDYFIVRASGMETRVHVERKMFNEYSSPYATISDVVVESWTNTKKLSITPTVTVNNMEGKKIILCATLINPRGETVNDVTLSMQEIVPGSNSHSISSSSLIIDYGTLGLYDLTGYNVWVGLYDEECGAYFSGSEQVPVLKKKSRAEMESAIHNWGKCRLVAITEGNGDIAINGGNGYYQDGLPSKMLEDLEYIRGVKEHIQDITLTEKGEYVIIFGENGVRCSNNIPSQMYDALRRMNNNRETITSAVFNDNGDWIVVSDETFNASSSELLNIMKKGCSEYGHMYSACLTNDGYIIIYEKGFKSGGYHPQTLIDAVNNTRMNVFTIKIAGESWFFADKDGHYQMLM